MPKFHLSETVPGTVGSPRKPVVTERVSVGKLQPMRDMIPLAPVETVGPRWDRGFTAQTITDEYGFQDVRPGWFVGDIRPAKPMVPAPNRFSMRPGVDDVRRHQNGVWTDGHGTIIRTVDMGDAKLRGVPKPEPKPEKAPRKGSTKGGLSERQSRALAGRTTVEDVIAFATEREIPGLTPEKLRDKRVISLIRDLMAHEASGYLSK